MTSVESPGFIRLQNSGGFGIPIVNLAPVSTADEAQLRVLAAALGRVCREVGFFCIENHGISAEFLQRAQDMMQQFFLLPEEEKLKIHISKSPFHRGYFPNGEENALGNPLKDIKEGFDMALELPLDDPAVLAGKPFHGPNAWPEVLPEFKPTMLRLYEEWRAVCARIASVFSIALGLPTDYFVHRTDKPLCQLRAAKYPPQLVVEQEGAIGCGSHTDYGVVSIIWQIDVPGLQMQANTGEWVDIPRIPGTFVCPLGDFTERWTNGHWKATMHRVINSSTEERHSSGFFFDPNYDCEIVPLPAFVTPERPALFEPTTMGAHVARGFNGTFGYRAAEPARAQ